MSPLVREGIEWQSIQPKNYLSCLKLTFAARRIPLKEHPSRKENSGKMWVIVSIPLIALLEEFYKES
jgi:hypothetical protein